MNSKHLSNDRLIDALYGATAEPTHLRNCTECRERFHRLRAARQDFVAKESEVPDDLLATQRQAIQARLQRPVLRTWARLAPVAAVLVVVAAFLLDFARHPTPNRPAPQDDAEVFQEVFELVSDPAPQPVEPIRTFFEESQ